VERAIAAWREAPIGANRHTVRWVARDRPGTAHRRGTRVAFSPSVTRSQAQTRPKFALSTVRVS